MDSAQERFDYYAHSFEQSRRFRGLKVWLGFKRYGRAQLARWVEANIEHARHLHERVAGHPDFESATHPIMSALCIRYRPGGRPLAEDQAARLHAEVARRIEENGRFWITTTRMKDRSWFRINPVNFRTRLEHMDGLLEELERECAAALGATAAWAPA
jgi:glutamate/tyrosine decarboxylase-like PLP-dependent enzyme